MPEDKTTVRSRELGAALRSAMEQTDLNGRRIAHRLDWHEGRVSRLLTGKPGISVVDVSAVLALCHITGKERDRLLRLAEEQATPGWLQQFGSRLPKQVKTLVDHETRALAITEFELHVIPGLLQTGDYAQALLERSATVPLEEVQDRVSARLGRQGLFSRTNRPEFTFYLHEYALRLPVGSRDVMSDQLHQLLRLSVRSYVSIRVIPAGSGAHGGTAGSCRLMEFAEFRPVVYVEGETSGLFLEEPAEIAAYQRIFSSLDRAGLDQEQSRELIRTLAVGLYPDGADQCDRLAEEQL